MSNNKVKYGLKNVHYSVITDTAGVITYAVPVPLPGAVELTLNPIGDPLEVFADDQLYVSKVNNQGYDGTLVLGMIGDQFKKDVLGYAEDNNGVLFESKDGKTKSIALLYEFDGDANRTRRISYNVSVGRPGAGSKSNSKGIEAQTDSMPIKASPAIDSGYVNAKAEPTQTPYETWFGTVYKHVPVV